MKDIIILFISGAAGAAFMFILICYIPEIIDIINFFRRKKENFVWGKTK